MLLESTLFKSFTYFSMMFKSDIAVILLVVTIKPLLSNQIKLTKISNLTFLKGLLILVIIYTFDYTITLSILFNSIEMMTCFLEGSFCHMQAHPSGNYISMVISSQNYTSLPSTVATFLTTCLMVVLQPSRYSVFYGRDTFIQLGFP